MAGHWEPCTDVEARDELLAGGKAQAELWNEFVSITWDDSTGAFWWSSSDKSGHPWHVPGRKFRRWVEDAPRTPLDDWPRRCYGIGGTHAVAKEEGRRACGQTFPAGGGYFVSEESSVTCQECRQVVGLDPPDEREAFEDTEPVLPDVPEGCERYRRDDSEHAWRRADGGLACAVSPWGTRYFEFTCPDGKVREAATPTAWWSEMTRSLWESPHPAEKGQWLHASAAIVEVA